MARILLRGSITFHYRGFSGFIDKGLSAIRKKSRNHWNTRHVAFFYIFWSFISYPYVLITHMQDGTSELNQKTNDEMSEP